MKCIFDIYRALCLRNKIKHVTERQLFLFFEDILGILNSFCSSEKFDCALLKNKKMPSNSKIDYFLHDKVSREQVDGATYSSPCNACVRGSLLLALEGDLHHGRGKPRFPPNQTTYMKKKHPTALHLQQ